MEPALLCSFPAVTAPSAKILRQCPGKTAAGFQEPLRSLYHGSDCWIWILMLKKRQNHFNPHAANDSTSSCQSLLKPNAAPSEVQVLSDVSLFNPDDSRRGNFDNHYPQLTDEEAGAYGELRELAHGYSSGSCW